MMLNNKNGKKYLLFVPGFKKCHSSSIVRTSKTLFECVTKVSACGNGGSGREENGEM